MRDYTARPPQICFLGSADPGSDAYSLSGDASEFIASLGYILVSGWSDSLENNPPDERENSVIAPWSDIDSLRKQFSSMGFPT